MHLLKPNCALTSWAKHLLYNLSRNKWGAYWLTEEYAGKGYLRASYYLSLWGWSPCSQSLEVLKLGWRRKIVVEATETQNLQSLWENFQVSYLVHYCEDRDTLSMRKKLGDWVLREARVKIFPTHQLSINVQFCFVLPCISPSLFLSFPAQCNHQSW
jgi:hypothetical protein